MAGPLDGIRVVEITLFQQGPVCGMILGDLGADVIKVEPKTGDPARGFMRIAGVQLGLKGRNFYFENNNRNKRSIVLDMKKEEGKEIFFKLIENADVFLTNMSLDAPNRMGIGYEVLSVRNPRLIYAHASGWGRKGPDSHALSYDYLGLARSGMMLMCGEEGTPPQNLVPGLADQMGAIMTAFGIVSALYTRERTGEGQLVDTSLLGAMIELEGLVLAAPCMLGGEFPRPVRTAAGNPLWNHYKCRDGKWIALAHIQPDRYWSQTCRALGIEELEHDPRFEELEARTENAAELISILDEKFASKDRNEWMEIFKKEGLIYSLLQSATEVTNDPQALANDYFVSFDHPVLGKTKMVGFPWMFNKTPAAIRREAPEFGQHTEEILLEVDYSWDDIIRLKDEDVI